MHSFSCYIFCIKSSNDRPEIEIHKCPYSNQVQLISPFLQEISPWWIFLAVCHAYSTLLGFSNCFQCIRSLYRAFTTSKGNYKEGVGTLGLLKRLVATIFRVLKESAVPILIGLVLYLPPLGEKTARYCLAAAVILTRLA